MKNWIFYGENENGARVIHYIKKCKKPELTSERKQMMQHLDNYIYQRVGYMSIYKNKCTSNMRYTKEMIDQLIDITDADGVWSMMQDLELQEESEYIEKKYFNIG